MSIYNRVTLESFQLIQSSPVKSTSIQSSPVQSTSVQSSLVHFHSVQLSLVQSSSTLMYEGLILKTYVSSSSSTKADTDRISSAEPQTKCDYFLSVNTINRNSRSTYSLVLELSFVSHGLHQQMELLCLLNSLNVYTPG